MRLSGQRDSIGRPVKLYGADGFEGMRAAGALAAATLDFIAPHVVPGVTTLALDRLLEGFMRDHGAVPATIGYRGYRHASCISVNHVVTHGIPSDAARLAPGDILNIDVTPKLDGWHGDTSRMYVVGSADPKARQLIDATYEALMSGIAEIRPGAHLGDVGGGRGSGGAARALFHRRGFRRAWRRARVPRCAGRRPSRAARQRHPAGAGMIFTVEPMLNIGRPEVKVLPDGWTTVTRDGSLSAQFEHSVGVTEDGVEIFTLPKHG